MMLQFRNDGPGNAETAGGLAVSPRVEPVAEILLARSPPRDIDNSDIKFPVSTDDFGSWPGEDWLP
jgi:hypothetical protein